MMRKLLHLLLCLLASVAFADTPTPPPVEPAFELPSGYSSVNDYNGSIPPSVQVRLADKLDSLQRLNGTQIVVLTVPSTGNEGVAAYSLRAAQTWNIGNNQQGNGVLFLIEGRTGAFYIRTGGGISGALPDIWLKQMIETTITPRWNSDHYLEALEAGVDAMIEKTRGERTLPAFYDKTDPKNDWKTWSLGGIGAFALFALACSAGWRRWQHQPLPTWRTHGLMLAPFAIAALGVALYPDPLAELLKQPSVHSSKGDFQIHKLEKVPFDLNRFASPNHFTVLVVTPEEIGDSSLENKLRDLAALRPDVAFRIAKLDFKDWNTGMLKSLYHQDMGVLPYFMIFGWDGKALQADRGEKRSAADLLETWHMAEARRQAHEGLCEHPALGC